MTCEPSTSHTTLENIDLAAPPRAHETARAMAELPTGTVTFFFSDIEGSTRLIEALGTRYGGVLERHHALIRKAFAPHRGTEIGTEGDSFFAVFPTAVDALEAAVDIQRRIDAADWPMDATLRVRIGLHTGEGRIAADSYVGLDVHRASRIMSAAHGAQILVSEATRALAARSLPAGVSLHDLGEHRLRDLSGREHLYQVTAPGLREEFPPPRTLDATPNKVSESPSSRSGSDAGYSVTAFLSSRPRRRPTSPSCSRWRSGSRRS
jgi:class 3 adenylate cyclase